MSELAQVKERGVSVPATGLQCQRRRSVRRPAVGVAGSSSPCSRRRRGRRPRRGAGDRSAPGNTPSRRSTPAAPQQRALPSRGSPPRGGAPSRRRSFHRGQWAPPASRPARRRGRSSANGPSLARRLGVPRCGRTPRGCSPRPVPRLRSSCSSRRRGHSGERGELGGRVFLRTAGPQWYQRALCCSRWRPRPPRPGPASLGL